MREGWPRPVVTLLTCAFALALLGLLAYFASSPPGVVLDLVGVLPALMLTVVLSGTISLTAALLAFHYEYEAYGSGEEVLFRACFIVSTGILLFSGIWLLGILVFG